MESCSNHPVQFFNITSLKAFWPVILCFVFIYVGFWLFMISKILVTQMLDGQLLLLDSNPTLVFSLYHLKPVLAGRDTGQGIVRLRISDSQRAFVKLFALRGDIIRSGKITACPAVTLEMLKAFAVATIQHAYVITTVFFFIIDLYTCTV